MKSKIHNPRDPRNPRPLLYLHKAQESPSCFWFHGISFAEFHAALKVDRTLILLAGDNLDIDDEDGKTRLEYVESDKIGALAGKNIYDACGDFIWVDTFSPRALHALTPHDLAALLYMGHTFKPLESPFFSRLKNQFAYFAHDDGWLLGLYARQIGRVSHLIERVIAAKYDHFFGIQLGIKGLGSRLLRLAAKGVLLDFRGAAGTGEISVAHPGPFVGMDELLNSMEGASLEPFASITSQGWVNL